MQNQESALELPSSKEQLQAILWQMRADLERLAAEAGPARMEQPGASGDWTLKDVIAHLTAWRWWSVARMEAAVRDEAPVPPWDSSLDEHKQGDVDQINEQFHEATRGHSVDEVLRDSRATMDRFEAALLKLSEADLFTVNRYSWLGGYPAAAVVVGSAGHLREHDETASRDFLSR